MSSVDVRCRVGSRNGTYHKFEVFRERKPENREHTIKRVMRVVNSAKTHPTQTLTQRTGECGDNGGVLHAANISGLSRYCQYSRLGTGSRSDAGRDRRLCFTVFIVILGNVKCKGFGRKKRGTGRTWQRYL